MLNDYFKTTGTVGGLVLMGVVATKCGAWIDAPSASDGPPPTPQVNTEVCRLPKADGSIPKGKVTLQDCALAAAGYAALAQEYDSTKGLFEFLAGVFFLGLAGTSIYIKWKGSAHEDVAAHLESKVEEANQRAAMLYRRNDMLGDQREEDKKTIEKLRLIIEEDKNLPEVKAHAENVKAAAVMEKVVTSSIGIDATEIKKTETRVEKVPTLSNAEEEQRKRKTLQAQLTADAKSLLGTGGES